MKKDLLLSAVCALVLFSCKKETRIIESPPANQPPISLQKSFLGDHTVTQSGTSTLFEFVVKNNNTPGAVITDGTLRLTPSNGLDLRAVKNVTVVITNSTGVVWTGQIADVATAVVGFRPKIPLDIAVVDTITVSATVTGLARGTLSGSLELGYISQLQSRQPISTGLGGAPAQTVTFTTAILTTVVVPTQASMPFILAGREDTTLIVRVGAVGGDMSITALSVTTATPVMAKTVTVYDGMTALGHTSVFDDGIATIPITLLVKTGKPKDLTVTVLSKPIDAAMQARINMKTTLTGVQYKSSSGELAVNDTARCGVDRYLVNSYARITILPIPDVRIINNASMPILHFAVTAVGGPVSWKQLGMEISFGDQFPDDTLSLKNFKLFSGTVERTSLVQFYDRNGQPKTTYTESDTKLFMTWVGGTNEDLLADGTKDYWLWATPTGFTTGSGDAIEVSVPRDPSGTIEYRQLTFGPTGSGQTAKLQTSTGAVSLFNFIWSDRSAGSRHSANGALGSDDFFTGAYAGLSGGTQIFTRQK